MTITPYNVLSHAKNTTLYVTRHAGADLFHTDGNRVPRKSVVHAVDFNVTNCASWTMATQGAAGNAHGTCLNVDTHVYNNMHSDFKTASTCLNINKGSITACLCLAGLLSASTKCPTNF